MQDTRSTPQGYKARTVNERTRRPRHVRRTALRVIP